MKELSLNLLDIAENSVKAGASLTQLLLTETDLAGLSRCEERICKAFHLLCGHTAAVVRNAEDQPLALFDKLNGYLRGSGSDGIHCNVKHVK